MTYEPDIEGVEDDRITEDDEIEEVVRLRKEHLEGDGEEYLHVRRISMMNKVRNNKDLFKKAIIGKGEKW